MPSERKWAKPVNYPCKLHTSVAETTAKGLDAVAESVGWSDARVVREAVEAGLPVLRERLRSKRRRGSGRATGKAGD